MNQFVLDKWGKFCNGLFEHEVQVRVWKGRSSFSAINTELITYPLLSTHCTFQHFPIWCTIPTKDGSAACWRSRWWVGDCHTLHGAASYWQIIDSLSVCPWVQSLHGTVSVLPVNFQRYETVNAIIVIPLTILNPVEYFLKLYLWKL